MPETLKNGERKQEGLLETKQSLVSLQNNVQEGQNKEKHLEKSPLAKAMEEIAHKVQVDIEATGEIDNKARKQRRYIIVDAEQYEEYEKIQVFSYGHTCEIIHKGSEAIFRGIGGHNFIMDLSDEENNLKIDAEKLVRLGNIVNKIIFMGKGKWEPRVSARKKTLREGLTKWSRTTLFTEEARTKLGVKDIDKFFQYINELLNYYNKGK